MRVLVVPDIHLKPEIIEEADYHAPRYDLTVFLGDYLDDWGVCHPDPAFETLDALERFWDKHPTKLLWGNHDYAYVCNQPCPGHQFLHHHDIQERLLALAQKAPISIAFQLDLVVFSHAGLSASFYKRRRPLGVDDLNLCTPRELWVRDSPLWLRPPFIRYDPDLMQVVGHTPVRTPYMADRVIYCDTYSTDPNGEPLGDQSLLWVDTITQDFGIANDFLLE